MDYSHELPSEAELLIIGGGVVGAATAFYAAQAGLQPVVVEMRPAPCSLTTPASTGAFRLQFDNLQELELVRESVDLFLNFREHTQQTKYDLGIRQQGYLFCTTDPQRLEWQRELVAQQHGWGQEDIELLSGDEARELFPYLGQNVLQARFRPDDGFLDPKQLTMGLLAASGATVVLDCCVTGFDLHDGRLAAIETNRGRIATAQAVIASGPFSGPVAALAGLELPLETVRRHKLVMPELPQVPRDAPMTIDEDTGAHWRPALAGAYLLWTDPTTPPSDPSEAVQADSQFYFSLLDPASPTSVSRIVPFWEQVWRVNTAPWMLMAGQYTMTPDHRPLLGPSEVEGLWLNCGYSGHGIMGSPAGSRLLVDLLIDRLPAEQNQFRFDREFEPRELDIL